MNNISHNIRVYYEDTDSGGVVYYANYLKFAERARTEALRQAGLEQSTLMRDHDVAFVVRRCVCEFIKPAMLDDLLTVHTTLHDISRVSITMHQSIVRGDVVLFTLEVKLAVVSAQKTLAKLPDFVHKAMQVLFDER